MTDPRGRAPSWMPGRTPHRTPHRTPRRLAVVALATFALCVGGGAAWAAWVAAGPAAGPTGPVTSWAVPATATACTDTEPPSGTAEVAWPETSAPYVLDYTATIDGMSAPVADGGAERSVTIDQALLEQLFGSPASGTLTVEVVAVLPGTSWTAPVATETIEAVVIEDPPELTLECTS